MQKEENSMYDLITVDFDNEKPTVSGRELHIALEVKTPYHIWFPRMCEYGFTENTDYSVTNKNVHNSGGGKQSIIDHELTISTAKEICMLQRNEKGKKFRKYFITVEEMWNSPEMVMKRALRITAGNIETLMIENTAQKQQIAELKPKASYYDIILNCKDLLPISIIAKDYGWTAARLNSYLHEKGIQYKQSDIWLLYQKYAENGYTSTKTHTYDGLNGSTHSKVHTYWTQSGRLFIYELLKSDDILPIIERNKKE